MHANFQGSNFKTQDFFQNEFQKLPLFATLTPLAPRGVVIFFGYLTKKSYKCPTCMYANFQGSSFKTEDFFRSVYVCKFICVWVSQNRIPRAGFSFGSQLKTYHSISTLKW